MKKVKLRWREASNPNTVADQRKRYDKTING